MAAGLGSQEEARPQDAAQAERHPPGAPAEPSGENDLPPAGSRQPQGARREQRPETVRRGAPSEDRQMSCRLLMMMRRMHTLLAQGCTPEYIDILDWLCNEQQGMSCIRSRRRS